MSFCSSFFAVAEVIYLLTNPSPLPPEEVAAVEARVALPAAKIGRNKAAAWTLSWPGAAVTLKFKNNDFVDGIDRPKAEIICGETHAVVTDCFDYSGGFNTISVEWGSSGVAKIFGGADGLKQLLEIPDLPLPADSLCVSATADFELLDLIVETNDNSFAKLQTNYSPDDLQDAKIWKYLDRVNDPAVAIIGGTYVLAELSSGELIYLGGAKTNASSWTLGMLKGKLKPTGFVGYYKLEWYDATGRLLPDECFAQKEGDKLLTVNFPGLQSSIRFSAE